MRNILIIGGAGFIGINAAKYFCAKGDNVVVYDNFSRKGSKHNIQWLKQKYPSQLTTIVGDIEHPNSTLNHAVSEATHILHLAAQVAVTTSVKSPRHDFMTNAIGTFNVLEAVREHNINAPLIYSSTNKVYGSLEQLPVKEESTRYAFADKPNGVGEEIQLDFHSPYGCSKGIADQYMLDYARIYGLKTVVFRQSCIYGERQFGVEDQGWVAWFCIQAVQNKPLTIYGTGKQVRDLLWVEDLVNAYDLALQNIDKTAGKAYNMGGGTPNTLSLLELVGIINNHPMISNKISPGKGETRPGDQPVFVADTSKFRRDTGWTPKVNPTQGVGKLISWVAENKSLFN